MKMNWGRVSNVGLGIGIAGAVGGKVFSAANKFRENVVKNLHPNVDMAQGSGRFGMRVAGQSQPAALQGLRFTFRRK